MSAIVLFNTAIHTFCSIYTVHGVSFRELATGGRPLRRTGCHRDFERIRHNAGDCGRTGPFIKDVPEYRKL